jgi:hypothetical protein
MPFLPLNSSPAATEPRRRLQNQSDYYFTSWAIQLDLLGRKFRSPK